MSDAPDDRFGHLDLDEELHERIKPELAPGERLLWAGRSRSRAGRTGNTDLLSMIFIAVALATISGTGFLLDFAFDRLRAVEGLVLGLSVLAGFFAAGTLLVLGAILISDVKQSRQSLRQKVYALTDRRAIFWTPSARGRVEVKSAPFTGVKVATIARSELADGSGDLRFLAGYPTPSGFEGIRDVHRVERILRDHLPRSAWRPESTSEADDLDELIF